MEDRQRIPYPAEYVEKTSLRDGTPITIRPIRPDDAPHLQVAFSRLSPDSVYLRFLEAFRELPDKQARDFASVDYFERMAFVGTVSEIEGESLIGVARYAIVKAEDALAECAVVVVDEYQNRGLGSLLLNRLVRYARLHGVKTLLATVHVSNEQIMRFITHSGLPSTRKMIEPGVWEVRLSLEKLDG
jgi:acetyltransferase